MDGWLTATLVFAGVVVSSFFSYFVARRNNSGSISTSDAKSLWDESNKLRQEYRERAESLEQQLEEVNTRLQTVMDELTNLRANSTFMSEKISELKKIIQSLRSENERLLALKQEARL